MDEMLENRSQAAFGLAGKCCQGFYPASYPLISTKQHAPLKTPSSSSSLDLKKKLETEHLIIFQRGKRLALLLLFVAKPETFRLQD